MALPLMMPYILMALPLLVPPTYLVNCGFYFGLYVNYLLLLIHMFPHDEDLVLLNDNQLMIYDAECILQWFRKYTTTHL